MHIINKSKVVHETIDGETVIINTETGIYYTANEYASVIWNALADGCSFSEIYKVFEKEKIFSKDVIQKFLKILMDENLIIKSENEDMGKSCSLSITKNSDFNVPVLSKFTELQELIELDPIHEVNTEMGWPFQIEGQDDDK